jgi:hypothetical protein
MFNRIPSSNNELENLKNLLAEKYKNVTVRNVSSSNNEVTVKLLNGRNGVEDGIDEENERPIEYLKSFDANVSKEKAEHSYWSYSIIKFNEARLKEVVDGLKLMQTPKSENHGGKMMARC